MYRPIGLSVLLLLNSVTISVGQDNRLQSDTLLARWETHLFPMTTSSMDSPTDQVVDALGNLYVTGQSEGRETGYDYYTVKYHSSGQIEWTARYDGNFHGADIPVAIAVDQSSNVYVTGMSIDSDSTFNDIVTIKYSAGGQRLWVAEYNGPGSVLWGGNGTDAPSDLVVDPAGNVFVTGFRTSEWAHDFVTIRYNAQGIEQWVAVYNGPAGGDDEAKAIALDQSGSIYVTGVSDDSLTYGYSYHGACVTIKYDQSGNIIWVQRYSGPEGLDIAPVGISIDGNGNSCIAANQILLPFYPNYISKHDIVTLKYAPDGEIQWARVFTSPNYEESPVDIPDLATGIAIDAASNIYVTGVSGNGPEYSEYYQAYGSLVTIKYFPEGSKHWARYYASTGDGIRSSGITVDPLGKIHVAGSNMHFSPWWNTTGDYLIGYDVVVLQYNSDRVLEWTQSFETQTDTMMVAKGICSDAAGNVYIIGEHGTPDDVDYASFKISPSGSQVWSTSTNGPGSSIAFIADAKVDQQGNIYVTGSGVGKGSNQDYTTMKIAPNGLILWSATYDSPDHFGDHPKAIDIDQSGNVYVTGLISQEGPYGWSSATIKYGPAGHQEWVARFDSSEMKAVAVDSAGNVFVGGLGIVKYKLNGEQQWHSPGNFWVTALATGDSGYIYATGRLYPTEDHLLKKFNTEGLELWTRAVDAWDLALDDSGNVYVSGPNFYPGTGGTWKFSPSGTELWSVAQGGHKIITFGSSGAYILFNEWGPRMLYKIGADGGIEWSQTITSDLHADFDIDIEGNAYVTTWIYGWNPEYTSDIFTTKYSANGEIAWMTRYDGINNTSSRASKVRVDSGENVYLFLEMEGSDFSTTPMIAKNNQLSSDVLSAAADKLHPERTQLSQNYPNPFNPTTVISYQLKAASPVSLKVYDILGREVATLVDGKREAGNWRQEWRADGVSSGVYFYRLIARALNGGEVFVRTKKMVLVR